MNAATAQQTEDPILSQLIEEGGDMFADFDESDKEDAYGLGTWPKAKLTDVETYAASDKGFGYRVGLKVNLKGDEEKMPYTGRLDLPRTLAQDAEDWKVNGENRRRAAVNYYLKQFGSPKKLAEAFTVDTDEQYEKIVNLFRQLVGNTGKMIVQADGKNVKQEDGGWKFVANSYTKLGFPKASRK